MPGQVLFGRGRADDVFDVLAGYGPNVLLVRGRSCGFADKLLAWVTANGTAHVIHGQGEPTLEQLETGLAQLEGTPIDCVVAVGGGSVIDLAKALAALIPQTDAPLNYLEGVGQARPLDRAPLPFIALPTTAGTGAEATKNAVIQVSEHRRKVSLRDLRMLANVAIVDPALTDHCPRAVTLASGMDAITQVIEPYLSCRANALTDAICRDAIPRGLAAMMSLAKGEDKSARDEIAYISLCGGIALANAGLGAVHGLAGVVGGETGQPHGVICARLLAPILTANHRAMLAEGRDMTRMIHVQNWIAKALHVPAVTAFDSLGAWIIKQGVPALNAPANVDDWMTWAKTAQGASSMKGNPVSLNDESLVTALKAASC